MESKQPTIIWELLPIFYEYFEYEDQEFQGVFFVEIDGLKSSSFVKYNEEKPAMKIKLRAANMILLSTRFRILHKY